MKNLFFISFTAFLAILSCRSTDDDVQRIDQIIQLYIDSSGQDLLNSKLLGSYTAIKINDVYGLTDDAPVNYVMKKNSDTINYIEYLADARRILIDSNSTSKTYESKVALQLTKKINDSTTFVSNDTMKIQYASTPQVFEVSKIYYNNILQFTKTESLPNIVRISK